MVDPSLALGGAALARTLGRAATRHNRAVGASPALHEAAMNIQDAVKAGFTRYVDFNGCATRPEFWWWILFTFVAQAVLHALSQNAAGLFGLLTLVPTFAVGARRLHDIDRSGWFQLLGLIPLVGIVILIVWWAQPAKRPTRYE